MTWKKNLTGLFCTLGIVLFYSCSSHQDHQPEDKTAKEELPPPLFELLSAQKTHVDFNNQLTEGLNTNVMAYEYFYNGGGVAVGDVNGDGWEDLYFTGNMIPNKLYLNQTDSSENTIQFNDITQEAGVEGRKGPWATGVTMADVNADGKLDIYVCYSGNVRPENRTNLLFINMGNDSLGVPVFEEQGAAYGLASSSTSTQATFFDFDRDGDLDMFLLNHSPVPLPVLDEASTANFLKKENQTAGVRLFENRSETGKIYFEDITSQSGLSSSELTYGLGAGIADVNNDQWPDIYVSNDYAIPDYLYINQKNGTFSNQADQAFGHISHFSMGNDLADINNDGATDIFTLDMLPEDNKRQKLLFAPDNYEKFNLNLKVGFHYQYMRNMLQVNLENGQFMEVGQMAHVSNTDWSWAPLLADFDNDGWKDLFITNGYVRDFTNMDFMKYMGDFIKNRQGNLMRKDVLELVHQIPSSNVTNYFFKHQGDQGSTPFVFEDVSKLWGFTTPSNSNGAVYADLDQDGDLDLIVNNINKPAFIYQNQSRERNKQHYLAIELKGEHKNPQGIGTQVLLYTHSAKQMLTQMPSRGFQSSTSPTMHFGLGKNTQVDSLEVLWPSGKIQRLDAIPADQKLILKEKDAQVGNGPTVQNQPIFTTSKPPFKSQDQRIARNDFKRQPLMVNPVSFSGPCLAKSSDNERWQYLFVGGDRGVAGQVFIAEKGKKTRPISIRAFEEDKMYQDTDAVFVDIDQDGDQDLYVTSGGYAELLSQDTLLQDRLYLNDGNRNFERASLPKMLTSTSCVRVQDLNGDQLPDLFVGGRIVPGRYPEAPQSYLLINQGKEGLVDQTKELAKGIQHIGMVTDATWTDLDQDGKTELVVVGDWMPIAIFSWKNQQLEEVTTQFLDKQQTGWWNTVKAEDLNHDGYPDLIAGNMGDNHPYNASEKNPLELFYKDFDKNGSVDPIFCYYIQGQSYPAVTRDELLDQMTMMRSRFPDYKSYANATLKDIFNESELDGVQKLTSTNLQTALFLNQKGRLQAHALPHIAQVSPVFTINVLDYNQDNQLDLLLCGNINQSRLRFGKSDANYGVLLKGNGKGEFEYVPQKQSGLQLTGDVRSVLLWQKQWLFGINQEGVKAYSPLHQEIL